MPLAIPQLLHTGSTITNDVLFNLCAAVLAFFLAGVLRGDRSVRTAVFVGLALGAALLTKAFGTVLVPWVAIAYVVGWRRHRTRAAGGRRARRGRAHRVRRGRVVVAAQRHPLREALAHPDRQHAHHGIAAARLRTVGGGVGREVRAVDRRAVLGLVRLVHRPPRPAGDRAGVGGRGWPAWSPPCCPRRSEERTHPTPLESAVLLLPLAGLLVFVAVRSFSRYRTTSAFVFIQGRYLLGAVIPIAVVVAAGLHRLSRRWAVPTLAGLALVMQVDAVWVMLRDWWAEPGAGLGRRLDAVLAWGPWPVGVPYLVALAVVATAAWTTFEIGALAAAPCAARRAKNRTVSRSAPPGRWSSSCGRSWWSWWSVVVVSVVVVVAGRRRRRSSWSSQPGPSLRRWRRAGTRRRDDGCRRCAGARPSGSPRRGARSRRTARPTDR